MHLSYTRQKLYEPISFLKNNFNKTFLQCFFLFLFFTNKVRNVNLFQPHLFLSRQQYFLSKSHVYSVIKCLNQCSYFQ